jgi:hypothetical protein
MYKVLYRVVMTEDDIQYFSEQADDLMEMGWKPQGGVSSFVLSGNAMTRYTNLMQAFILE